MGNERVGAGEGGNGRVVRFLYGGENTVGTPASMAFSDGYFSPADWLRALGYSHRLILPVRPKAERAPWQARYRPITVCRSACKLLDLD